MEIQWPARLPLPPDRLWRSAFVCGVLEIPDTRRPPSACIFTLCMRNAAGACLPAFSCGAGRFLPESPSIVRRTAVKWRVGRTRGGRACCASRRPARSRPAHSIRTAPSSGKRRRSHPIEKMDPSPSCRDRDTIKEHEFETSAMRPREGNAAAADGRLRRAVD